MLLMVVGLVLFARLGLHATYASLLPGFLLFGAGAGLMNVPLTNAVMAATPAVRAGIASALLNASREVAGLLGITIIGAVLRTRQSAALRAGAGPVHAFLDGYHTGLLVTIALMAAGVMVSYLTLRPRPAATAVTAERRPSAGPRSPRPAKPRPSASPWASWSSRRSSRSRRLAHARTPDGPGARLTAERLTRPNPDPAAGMTARDPGLAAS